MATCESNGRVKFINDKFATSEMVVLTSHIRFLLGPHRIIVKGGIRRAYNCADQLEALCSPVVPSTTP